MANSPLGCKFDGEDGKNAQPNSRLVVSVYAEQVNVWSLKATKHIKAGEEILFRYSKSYAFPSHYGPALL
jgi:hypothetical protein